MQPTNGSDPAQAGGSESLENLMHLPKSVPWHARRAGISLERAEILWRQAIRAATDETGWVGTPEYWGAAMDQFLRLLAREQATLCAPRVIPLLRSQNRMLMLPLAAMEDMVRLLSQRWSASQEHHKAA